LSPLADSQPDNQFNYGDFGVLATTELRPVEDKDRDRYQRLRRIATELAALISSRAVRFEMRSAVRFDMGIGPTPCLPPGLRLLGIVSWLKGPYRQADSVD